MNTSADRTSRKTMSRASAAFRLSTMLRLPRLTALKLGLSPPTAPASAESSLRRRLDLDDVGAEIGKLHRAERSGHDLGHIEHADAFKGSPGHLVIWSSGNLVIGIDPFSSNDR